MIAEVQDFAKRKLGLNPATVSADFPWNRLFEIDAKVSPNPIYPVYMTQAAKRLKEEQEAARKLKEAQEQQKAKAESASVPVQAKGSNVSEGTDISTVYINK